MIIIGIFQKNTAGESLRPVLENLKDLKKLENLKDLKDLKD